MTIRWEPNKTKHVGPVRYATHEPSLVNSVVVYQDEPCPKTDVWVARTQDATVSQAADLGVPVIVAEEGPHIAHLINGIVGPFQEISWRTINHLTCAVPYFREQELPIPLWRPKPFPNLAPQKPLFYGKPVSLFERAWVEDEEADVGQDCYNRLTYVANADDLWTVAKRGGIPLVDRAYDGWRRKTYLLVGAHKQYRFAAVHKLEKIQRAALNFVWRNEYGVE